MNEIIDLFVGIPDKITARKIFADMFTPSELEALSKRWQIIKLLNEGQLSQREISEKLGVGIATITHGSQTLKKKRGGFTWLLQKLNKKLN